MAIAFQNPTRSFDPTVNCVRFSGHDSTIEVSFFVETEALQKLCPGMGMAEGEILKAFDNKLKQIHKVATRVYGSGKKSFVHTLTSDDF
ncbi:MAG: DUF1488 family protein [Proteobacteria bacterium]|nr:DUF1488 family protein [Pseudomonadota bacterium]